jgi:hypothetical protein
LQQKTSFSYYFNKNMINGIMVDMDSDTRTTYRSIYSIANWAGQVGGLYTAVSVFCIFLMPLIRHETLESYLVRRLFRSAPTSRVLTPKENCESAKKLLFMSERAVRMRGKIEKTIDNPILH